MIASYFDRLEHLPQLESRDRSTRLIECVLINRSDVEAMGAGETAITVTAAAIGNAIFDATGARLRQVPFTPARVKAALDAKS